MPPRSPNPDPISDQKMSFFTPFSDLTFKILPYSQTKMDKVYTRFQTKKSQNLYPLRRHVHIWKQPFPKVRLVENEYPSNATWKTSIKNLKEYKHNFKVINEWMNEWRVVDERTTDVPYLQYILNMWTVSSDVSIQKAPLTAALSPFMSLLYPPNPWCEWCDVWRLPHNTGVYVPYSFPTVVWVLLRPTRTK